MRFEPGHDGRLPVDVLEVEPQELRGPVALLAEAGDEPLLHEDAGDLALDAGRRDDHLEVLRPRRVADPREHVGDRIGHVHRRLTSWTWSRPAARPRGRAPGSRFGRARSGACTPAAVRRGCSGDTPAALCFGARLAFAIKRLLGHGLLSAQPAKGMPRSSSSLAGLLVGLRRRHDADLQPAETVDLVVIDLGERELLAKPEAVVAPPVEGLAGDPRGSRGCAAGRQSSGAPGSPTSARREG